MFDALHALEIKSIKKINKITKIKIRNFKLTSLQRKTNYNEGRKLTFTEN